MSYVIVHPTVDRAKPAHRQLEPYLYAGVAAERDNAIVVRGAQMLGAAWVLSDYIFVSVILPLKPGDEDYAISLVVPTGVPGVKLYPRRPYARFFSASQMLAIRVRAAFMGLHRHRRAENPNRLPAGQAG